LEKFKEKKIYEGFDNLFNKIEREWFLICAGNKEDFNMMTAGWGGFGIIWNKPVSTIYVRPVRHTFDLLEKYGKYSICFFDKNYKDKLQYCGSNSGRDVKKNKRM